MNERNTLVYKKYISHFILEWGPLFVVVWEIDGETYIQIRDFILSHIFFREPGVPTLAPPCKPYHQRRPNLLIGCVSLVWLPILRLCLNLTAWLSCGLLPVTYLFDLPTLTTAIALFTKYTGWQGTNRKSMSYVIKHKYSRVIQ